MKVIFQISNLLSQPLNKRLKVIGLFMIFVSILESFSIAMFVPTFTFILNLNNKYSQSVINYLPGLSSEQIIIFCLVFLVFFYFVKNFFQLFFLYFKSKFEADSQSFFTKKLYSIYLNSNYEFLIEKNSSLILRNITIETENIKHFFNVVLSLFSDFFILFFIFSFLLIYNFQITIICITIIFIIFLVYKIYFRPVLTSWGNKRLIKAGTINKTVTESFLNIKLIKLWQLENRFLNFINLANTERANLIRNLTIFNGMPKIFLELLVIIIFSFFFIFSVSSGYIVDEIILNFSIYGISFFKLLPSVNSVLTSYTTLKFYTPSAQKIVDEINMGKLEKNTLNNTNKKTINFFKTIELQDIYFSYPSSKENILQKINIKINLGDKIGIYGPSGSGKSTLVDLIIKLLGPTSGKIIIDGIETTSMDYSWGKKVGYIQQNSFLFDDTLKKNIILSDDYENQINNNNLNLEKVLTISKIDKFLKNLPNGLDTIVGDRGAKLSGGQKQRVAIARAIFNNPEIIVLDESTSQLDKQTQSDLMDDLYETFKDKTVILISHEYELFKNCNKIFYLENGMITKSEQ